MRSLNRFSRLSTGLWFVPLMCVLAGVGLSFGTIAIDRAYDYELIPQSISGGPDAALEILGTVAASMVSLAALVLTITMVVVQLAMGQFSPRIVQRILQDKPSQLAIGIFVGTFAHAMLTLREVQTGGEEVVPGIAVILAFVLVIISIMVLVWYVNHIGRSLRVSALILIYCSPALKARSVKGAIAPIPSAVMQVDSVDRSLGMRKNQTLARSSL